MLPNIIPQGKLLSKLSGDGRILLTSESNTDAFGRVRVSSPVTVFDAKMQYDEQHLLFESLTVGAGAVAHSAAEGAVHLSVGTASGDRVLRQSRRYCTYQPGKSQAVFLTGNLAAPPDNCRTRTGYYDDNNGVFFEQTADGIFLIFRSSVLGFTYDLRVPQSDWNCDRLDGTGPSGKTIATGFSKIFAFDMQWLGVGRVRAGFDMDGELICAHQFLNDNRNASTYWTTATLPIRYEIENTGPTSTGTTMRQICCSVQSEGGFDIDRGFAFSAANTADISVTTRRPILSIRPTANFKSIVNHQGILPSGFDVVAASNAAAIELVYDGTLTGASWSAVDSESGVEFDQAATTISGGHTIARALIGAGGNKFTSLAKGDFPALLWLTNSISGTTTTPLTVVATSFVAQATQLRSALTWVEIR